MSTRALQFLPFLASLLATKVLTPDICGAHWSLLVKILRTRITNRTITQNLDDFGFGYVLPNYPRVINLATELVHSHARRRLGEIPETFRRIQTAVLFNLFGITDGQWTSKAGVRDAEADADAFFMLAENDGCVDPPCRQVK